MPEQSGNRDHGEAARFFASAGRVGEFMQSMDWSATLAGPFEHWSPGLRRALGLLLRQPAPGFIFWGRERVKFYNDAYRTLVDAGRDPVGLGMRGRDYWPESWETLEPTLNRIHRGESIAVKNSLWLRDLQGEPEERYLDHFYSPLEGEPGKIEGVFCIVHDTTNEVVAARRLRTLTDLARGAAPRSRKAACKRAAAVLAANPHDTPFAALYLFDEDRSEARLAAIAGKDGSTVAIPARISFQDPKSSAVAQAALKSHGELVQGLSSHFGTVASAVWGKPVERGFVLPLLLPGQRLSCGFMVAGISPVQRLDESYRDFIQTVAEQTGSAIAAAPAKPKTRAGAPDGRFPGALEESERQLRSMVDCIPQLAWMARPDGHIFWYNERWYEYTGSTPEQMAGWGWQSVHDPEMLPTVVERWRESLRTGSPFEMEFPLRGADGSFRWFLTRVNPLRDDAGDIVRWFGTNTDVTEFKRIRDQRALLLEQEKKARAAAEMLNQLGPALLRELEPGKLIQTVTDTATASTGAAFGAFFHNLLNEKGESYTLYTLSGASREAFARFPLPRNTEVFGPTFRGEGIVRSDDITQDPRYGKNDPFFGMPPGHLTVKSYLAAPVISRGGDVMGGLFLGHPLPGRFTRDHESIAAGIAAQAAVALDNARLFEQSQWSQNELKRSNEELRRANADLETFAYSASHDLQEPLRNVAICAQLLQRSAGKFFDDDARKFLDGVMQGARRMESLVKDLLAYSGATRYAEGPLPLVNSGAVLSDVLNDLKSLIGECGAAVEVEELPVVSMHEVHLKQLFQNLIGNALKYRKEESPFVHISATRQHGWWVFSFADNGIGIDSRFADQIFGLFKRLHTQNEYAGSGIGLAICQRIVEQYGGRIWLERSVPGGGSVFAFSVPEP